MSGREVEYDWESHWKAYAEAARRRRLVSHPAAGHGLPARLLSRLFGALFRGNSSASPCGWQLLALLRRPDASQASHG